MPALRLTLLLLAGFGAADDTTTGDSLESTPEQRLAFASRAAAAYQFRITGREKAVVKLHPEPLLRWNNKVVREDDGMLFLWTEGTKGRPLATAQFFLTEDDWHHEFQSLSQSGFEARFGGSDGAGWSWQPSAAGINPTRAEGIDPPAESPTQRLRQMKGIAERFSAAVDQDDRFESPEQLRLLVTPIYRYSAADQGILDGALFAFTQGTNPEVLLLIEAEATDPGARSWCYGFARMSCFNLRVHQAKQLVWKADREPVPTRDRGSRYYFRRNAQRDESAAIDVPAGRTKER
jgi:hypothetical protein